MSAVNLCETLVFSVCFQFVNPEVPGYVGFANLPNQVHRKSVKKGFEFTLMVVGEYGFSELECSFVELSCTDEVRMSVVGRKEPLSVQRFPNCRNARAPEVLQKRLVAPPCKMRSSNKNC